ncbi:MAG: dimethyl sulfoxide reductase anchor subunit, partial [Nitrospinaceae bacterium]|nr:dimethyl sulfoxide reductase anchor subunit [Nitrospinaceae bacterium]NIR57782.1 dimethyl sulfoxide reductase anchor subunit [Nitrospinaceae bacterium]NIT85122.1 dimethyl sulfoxide reductase anchor subunit [Nitrospinaceae bacterium]NIX37439.1 dimethyl sulfoxide reductase anchor subunit [Nitrospinaceae bacterium]NIY18638.1 dimethyl sulfoxide reductase anchor subunit [Nitrospinaceae bacterium]
MFTITAALLVGWFAASLLTTISIPPILFLGIGVAGMGLSTLHLSKKLRGFRAIYNWRHSWLSREVLCYSGFIILAGLHFFLSPFNPYWGWLAVL